MAIDDELDAYIDELSSDHDDEMDEPIGVGLVREIQDTCREIAKALWERHIPPSQLMDRAPKPASRVMHFFKGEVSNPLVRVVDGWMIGSGIAIDTSGGIWQTKGDDPALVWEPADIEWWARTFSQDDEMSDPMVYVSGNYFYRRTDENGEPWIEMSRKVFPDGQMSLESLPVREALLRGAAELIAQHRS